MNDYLARVVLAGEDSPQDAQLILLAHIAASLRTIAEAFEGAGLHVTTAVQ